MHPQILGVSGSPIKNSNTDRLVQAVLNSSGLRSEFVKLSKINVRPCIACLGCTKDNICKPQDDFQELAEKVKKADAIVVGGYAPYGSVDGFTKAFLERLFSLRHQNGLNRGKLAVVIASGIGRGAPGLEEASKQIEHALTVEGMEILGNLKITGNTECLVCGYGPTCPMSSLPWVFGDDLTVTPDKFCKVEDQSDVWDKANQLGLEIAQKIKNRVLM
ncbi:putative iron-sulfur flavoprotein [Desulforapulum autotrophicum HRM2]|uniref:Iron-sulfur flavoprotein n=1 Tax=Desulforapulum autotrophicum (strain ATCC 43914 / DSM 3382 / VKM B-1955 / HRM2) TaxID=177437 RepID=C0Q942_DESAH|nr:flavodoxin family protein [Desulforapulum autotrophicum]ACN16547.1 putative iron-sulfur flavoprotein [Desulforapulum autotrophicum HRM2]